MNNEQTVNILIADTSDNSSEAVLTLLEQRGYTLKSQRITRKAELSDALSKQYWDILLLNDELADFNASECIDWLLRLECHTSLLLLTRKAIDTEAQTKAYNTGVAGLISLELPDYLLALVSRELDAVKARQQRSKLLNDNQELVERCRLLLSSSREAVTYIHQGMHIYANESYIQKFSFKDMDDVSSTPFIDLIGAKSRDELKDCLKQIENQWEDGQQKQQVAFDIVACKSDGKEFNAQLLLEPTLFEGEKCLQVFVSTEKENQKKLHQAVRLDFESGLFNRQFFLQQFDHLLSSINQGKVPGGMLLYVRLNMNDQLRSSIGFEAADKELRKFTDMLKQGMSRSNVVARFGDNDFIVMLAGDTKTAQLKSEITEWQSRFGAYKFGSLSEQGSKNQVACHLISIEIDDMTKSIKDVLTSAYKELNNVEQEQRPKQTRDRITAGKSKSLSEMGSIKIELVDKPEIPVMTVGKQGKARIQESPDTTDTKKAEDAALTKNEPPVLMSPELVQTKTEAAPVKQEVELKVDDLAQLISTGKIKLRYEVVIAVADIETEFNEVEVMLDDQRYSHISSKDIYNLLDKHPSSAKFDRLVLEKTLQVMTELHKQGQMQNFAVRLNKFSLKDEKLLPWLSERMKKNMLQPQSLIINIHQRSAISDVSGTINFLNALKELEMKFCISNFAYNDKVNNLIKKRRPDYIKLTDEVSSQIIKDEEQQSELEELIEDLHDENIKIIAGQVNDSSTLSAYWVCNVDLVQGKYFQKKSVDLNAATFTEDKFAVLGKIA